MRDQASRLSSSGTARLLMPALLTRMSSADDYRSTLLVSMYQATETRRRVAERAAPTQEARSGAGFQRGQFIDRLSEALTNRSVTS